MLCLKHFSGRSCALRHTRLLVYKFKTFKLKKKTGVFEIFFSIFEMFIKTEFFSPQPWHSALEYRRDQIQLLFYPDFVNCL